MLLTGLPVEVRRFELPTPTSLTWCANRAALHLDDLHASIIILEKAVKVFVIRTTSCSASASGRISPS
jgi:hypothetical protein